MSTGGLGTLPAPSVPMPPPQAPEALHCLADCFSGGTYCKLREPRKGFIASRFSPILREHYDVIAGRLRERNIVSAPHPCEESNE